MSDWTDGYVSDIGYTFGYYGELNPLRLKMAFINAGRAVPEVATACELGFGQGMSINLHAAASAVHWYGTDFNPTQVAFAQEVASNIDAGTRLFDESFEEFCNRPDLPDFDYIALHGIYSWISPANREMILNFLRRKLKVGGVLYISYNTQPGWSAMAPMRDLLAEHADVMGSQGGGILNRLDGALNFADELLATQPMYLRVNPHIADRINKIKGHNRHYVAHEYFNRNWEPMGFSRIARSLEPAKLQWACSAHYMDALDSINLSAAQQALLNTLPDPVFRQTARDFCVNQQFRKDYWTKGARTMNATEQIDALRQLRLVMVKPRQDAATAVTGALGEAKLQESVYHPILDLMADHKPRTVAQIETDLAQQPRSKEITLSQMQQALFLLCGIGDLMPAHDDALAQKLKKRTDRTNQFLMTKSRSSNDVAYLASPLTGGGLSVPRFHQLFLQARSQGLKQPDEWASQTWKLLQTQGQTLLKEGKGLTTPEENLAELNTMAQSFATKALPIYKALLVI